MNTYKAILDTSRSNGVIATITQFDNATLELQIVTNGEIEHAWESPQFELVAIKRDQYAVRESDQAAFTIKDVGEHLVSVDLKEQFLTCRGSTKMQLVVKDGDRLTTSVFYVMIGESLDHTIIESHRDVAVLDDLEAYIQTGREVIYDAQAIVTDLKDEMSEFNTSSSEKEAERQASELNRASKELVRIDNEETRVANEHDRVTNEEDRVTNEEERVANEHDRVTNEQNRRLAENTRIAQERARQDAELQRNSIFEENETIRKDGEKKRITNENEREKKFSTWEERETTRLRSEENRIIQEQVRVANEETRQRQEQTRQNQEDYRQRTYTQFNEAEANRVAKELQRQTAEEKRVVAETNRQNSYADRENERDRQYAESENTRNDAFNQNEANRQSEYTTAERERVESEELRKSRERERETAESQRVTTERERVNAEQKRIADFNREIKKSQDAMNQAASNVSGAIDTANSTMESIEQRAEACLPVIEQSSNEIERARVDYIGNQHSSIKKANDANVDWLLGEVNTTHYEGQHITATDTIEGQSKSAILKGVTDYKSVDWLTNFHYKYGILISTNGKIEYQIMDARCLTCVEINENRGFILKATSKIDIAIVTADENNNLIKDYGWYVTTTDSTMFTVENNCKYLYLIFRKKNSTAFTSKDEVINSGLIIKEQVLVSVQMPVLKSVGKNLLDITKAERRGSTKCSLINNGDGSITLVGDGDGSEEGTLTTSCYTYLEKGKTYTFSFESDGQYSSTNGTDTVEAFLLKDGSVYEYIHHMTDFITTFTCDRTGDYYVRFDVNKNDTTHKFWNIQLTEGATIYPFEPYKSNTLTTPEDLALRGIGDVKDELNVATGELTQRIKEVVLDGSDDEVWSFEEMKGDNYKFGLNLKTDVYGSGDRTPILSDKWAVGNLQTELTQEQVAIYNHTNYMELRLTISPNKLTSNTGQALKDYLKANPFTIQYALGTPTIKTVALSDNHVYSYKDVTHYDCSSAEGSLVPTLSIDVPTNLPAVVTRQRATIQELEKENAALKNEIEETANSSVNGDLELMSSQFELDFRLFEIEMNLDMPMMAMMRGVKSMAMTVYQQAKTLILAGKYEREDMEYKLNRYKAAGRITVEEYDELIALMDARELVD